MNGSGTWKRRGVQIWRWLPGWARQALVWLLNAHFVVGTIAIIRDREGRVLIARHTYRRHAPWALPGGWVRRGEDPADTIVREIQEETGLGVEILAPLVVQPEGPAHLTIVYAARPTLGTFRPSAEVSEVRFVAPGAWPEKMRGDHRDLVEVLCHHPVFQGHGA